MSQARAFPRAKADGFVLTDIFNGQSILEGHQSRLSRPMKCGLKRPRASSEQNVDVGRGCSLVLSPSPNPSE